ncbi:MAG: nitrous oxide reductase family maturation protein NosD [Dehalococcoidia bacterium]
MRKTLSIMFVLALVLSFSVVAATPVTAATTWYVDDDNCPGPGTGTAGDPFCTIQDAVDAASSGDTIMVAAGTYAGAIIGKQVSIVGDAGGGSVISSGVLYKASASLTTAFRLDAGADGTEIRNFTINCNAGSSFYFGVFGRGVDDVVVDGLTITDAVQGITNWGGSGWEITNNEMTGVVATSGGGIGIFLGATPPSYRMCNGNLVANNDIQTVATAAFTTPGITVALDVRYGAYSDLDWSEQLSYNSIIDNTVTGNGNTNQVGVEIGVIGLGGDSAKIAATMGLIHDNYVMGNTIDDVDLGLYFYVVEDLTATCNEVKNSATHGVSIWDDFTGSIHFNSIHGNAYGLYNDVSTRTIDAEDNWWGDASGPYNATSNPGGGGDEVSDNVDFTPWLGTLPAPTKGASTATGTGPASFATSGGKIADLVPVTAPGLPSVSFPHGMFSFQICCLDPGESAIVTVTLPSPVPVGTVWWKYDNGRWYSLPNLDDDGDNIMKIRLTDGGTGDLDNTPGQITDPGGPGNPMTVGWEGSPVSKSAVLWPWIALLVALMAGAGLLLWKRRVTQNQAP